MFSKPSVASQDVESECGRSPAFMETPARPPADSSEQAIIIGQTWVRPPLVLVMCSGEYSCTRRVTSVTSSYCTPRRAEPHPIARKWKHPENATAVEARRAQPAYSITVDTVSHTSVRSTVRHTRARPPQADASRKGRSAAALHPDSACPHRCTWPNRCARVARPQTWCEWLRLGVIGGRAPPYSHTSCGYRLWASPSTASMR